MLLELFSYVNFINTMAFVYAYIYIQCLDGLFNCFSLTFCIILIQNVVIIDCYPAGVSNKHCLLPLFLLVL